MIYKTRPDKDKGRKSAGRRKTGWRGEKRIEERKTQKIGRRRLGGWTEMSGRLRLTGGTLPGGDVLE